MTAQILLTIGPESFLARKAIADFTKTISAKSKDVQMIDLPLKGPESSTRLTEALSPSLLSTQSLVVVSDRTGQSRHKTNEDQSGAVEDASDTLAFLIGGLPAEIWLAIDLSGTRGRKTIIDAARAVGCEEVECEKPNARTLDSLISKEFSRRKRTIAPEAAAALRASVGDDVAALVNAIEQLCSDVQADQIEVSHVQIYHLGVADLPWYKVSEAVWAGSPTKVMQVVRQAFARDTTAALPIIAAVASDIRLMVRAAGLPRGMSDAEAGQSLGVHPFRVKMARKQLPRWSPTVLADAILSLAELDSLVKGGAAGAGLDAGSRQHLVETALVRIATGRG